MNVNDTFLCRSIRDSGKQRFMTWGLIYTLMVVVFFLVFTTISVREILEGLPSGPVVALAVIFFVFSGGLAYGSIRYLRYGLRIYRHPETAQFLTLWEGEKSFAEICEDVEAEKDLSLLEGIRNVTVTPSFLFVKQKGYFELYRHQDLVSISLGNARGRILTVTDKHGNDRELTQSWDERAIPRLMELLGLGASEGGKAGGARERE